MKKFLFIFFCFTFVCACKTAQKEMPSQEIKQAEQQIAAQEFMTEVPAAKTEIKEEKKETKTVKTAPKTKTKKEIKQTVKEEIKQEISQAPKQEIKTTEVKLDQANPPKEILKTDDGRLTHPWYFMQVSTFTPEGKAPLWFGEELNYKISWAFITAGEATIKADKILYNGKEYAYQIETIAKSYPVIDKMFINSRNGLGESWRLLLIVF